MALIDFEHVSKRYRTGTGRGSLRDAVPNLLARITGGRDGRKDRDNVIWALKDVSLQIDRGETLGIIGRNGAGKTTVLKLLSKITHPTSGQIRVEGRTSALIELGAGFHPDLTGRENIYLNASILGLKRQEVDQRFDQIVEFAELAPFIDTPVKRYSSGMYARLGFSVAAHVDPDLLLVDEVLSVGDILFQQKCLNRIREFQAAGKSIVFVSHNLVSVQKTCSRVVWLERGEIAAQGDPQDVVNAYVHEQMQFRGKMSGSQAGEVPLRYGTGGAAIERVRTLGGNEEEQNVFAPGESMSVEVTYRAPRLISPVNLFLTIANDKGIRLWGTDFRESGFDRLKQIEGTGSLRCCLPSLSLRPGAYNLIVGIETDGEVLDRQGMLAPFTVEPASGQGYLPPGRYGLFDVGAYWALGSSETEGNEHA